MPKIPPRKDQVKAVHDQVKMIAHKVADPYISFFKNFPWEKLKHEEEEPKMNLMDRLKSNKKRTEDAMKDN